MRTFVRTLSLSLGLALGSSCCCCLHWRQQLLLLLLLLLASASALALVAAGVGRTAVDVHGVVGWCPSTLDIGVVVIMTWPICRTSVTCQPKNCCSSTAHLLVLAGPNRSGPGSTLRSSQLRPGPRTCKCGSGPPSQRTEPRTCRFGSVRTLVRIGPDLTVDSVNTSMSDEASGT